MDSLHPDAETRGAQLCLAIVAAYLALVLASGRVDIADFWALFGRYLYGSLALWVLIGLGGALVLLYRRRPRDGRAESATAVLAQWMAERWRRDRLASLFAPPLLFAALMAAFNAFKQMILPGAGFRFDAAFAAADRMLFLGVDPWRVTHGLFASPLATAMIDHAYHGWFVPMSLGVVLCAFLPGSAYRLKTQYLLSYILVWTLIGSVLAFAFSSAGPCFYNALVGPQPGFGELLATLQADHAASGGHLAALDMQARLLGSFGADRLAAGGGISAMPSVHNALAVLFAIAGFRIHRLLGLALAAYALLIWIGSIHLGWHYALDGVVSALLTWGIWRFAGTIADRLARPAAAERMGAPSVA